MPLLLCLFFILSLLTPTGHSPAAAADRPEADSARQPARSAEQILAEYEALLPPSPEPERMQEPDYMAEYQRAFEEVIERQTRLIHELALVEPEHEALDHLLKVLWARTGMGEIEIPDYDPMSHMQEYLEREPSGPASREARLYLPLSRLNRLTRIDDPPSREERARAFAELDAFLSHHADEELVKRLELVFRKLHFVGPEEAELLSTIFKQIQQVAPNTRQARWAAGQLRRIEQIGQPFELAGHDLFSDEAASIEDYLGKVVVVLFWASHSQPSRMQLPRFEQLHEEFADRDVAFVGVPLESHKERVRSVCAQEKIGWPQIWVGEEAESFAEGWGILGVPEIFLIDHEGNLAATRGSKDLDAHILDLLDRRDELDKQLQ